LFYGKTNADATTVGKYVNLAAKTDGNLTIEVKKIYRLDDYVKDTIGGDTPAYPLILDLSTASADANFALPVLKKTKNCIVSNIMRSALDNGMKGAAGSQKTGSVLLEVTGSDSDGSKTAVLPLNIGELVGIDDSVDTNACESV
jgi:hypothetical protein